MGALCSAAPGAALRADPGAAPAGPLRVAAVDVPLARAHDEAGDALPATATIGSSAPQPLGPDPMRAAETDPDFPLPAGLRPAVAFWKRVYLEVTTQAGLIHDSRNLDVVYEVVRLDDLRTDRGRRNRVNQRKRHWKGVLDHLRRGGEPRDDEERNAVRLMEVALGHPPTAKDFSQARHRLRFQLGQRDKFRSGLITSGGWEDAMRAVFRAEGLPEDLAFLPHVESSFNVHAYSKYGAAGVWQFMRSTGRLFLKIDYVIDERLDPMIATHAAAELLRANYAALGSWPLAITAYNHGRAGMARAKRRLGTDQIDVIVRDYKSRRFGFASRNFYTQFLAARSILHSYESYFGPVMRDLPEPVDEVTLPFYASVGALREHLGVAPEVIKHYNPSLRPPVYRDQKRIPKGFVLRLPAGTAAPDHATWLAAIPEAKRHARQVRSNYYSVRRGDTLSAIARRNGTSVTALVSYNNLPSRHRIYPGQVLQIPDPGSSRRPKPSLSLVKSAHAATRTPAAPKPPAAEVRIDPAPPLPPPISEDSPWRRIDGDRVMVDDNETAAHFADWLGVSISRIRQLNGHSRRRQLRFGERIKLDFSRVSAETLLQKRMEYHKGIEEDFFGSFRITGAVEHELRRGESLWSVAHKSYSVPVWLIHRYNPDLDFTALVPGVKLRVPVVERLESS